MWAELRRTAHIQVSLATGLWLGVQLDVSWVLVLLHAGLPHSMVATFQEQVSQENKVGVAGIFITYPWKSLLVLVKAVTDVRPGSRGGGTGTTSR